MPDDANAPDDAVSRLRPTLKALVDWLEATKTPYLVIGGVAVSLVGRARLTRDIDAVAIVDVKDWPKFLESGVAFGFAPRIADPLALAHKSRILLLRHDPERNNVDVSLGALPFEREAIARGKTLHLGDFAIRVPSVEDLIIMKAVASRPIDLGDIDTLLDMHPNIDRRRVRRWVRDFADTLEMPEVFDKADELLKAKRAPTTKPKPKPPKRHK